MSDGGELEKLILRVEADLSGVESSLKTLVDKAGEASHGVEGHFGKMALAVAAAEVAVHLLEKGFEKLKELTVDNVKESMTHIVALERMSEKLGIGTEAMGGLAHAAAGVDVSMESMGTALRFMSKNMLEAQHGAGPAADAIDRLGLNTKDFFNLAPDAKFKAIADAMNSQVPASERAAMSMALFGRSGAEMVNVMALGSKGIEKETEEALKMGTAFSTVDAEKVVMAHQALLKVHETFEGVSNTLTIALAPILTIVAEQITGLAEESGGFKNVILQLVDALVTGAGYAADAWQYVKIGFAALQEASAAVGMSFWETVNAVTKGAMWMGTIISNFSKMVGHEFDYIGDAINFCFQKAQQYVLEFVKYSELKLSDLVAAIGAQMTSMGVKGADTVLTAAANMRSAANAMMTSIDKDVKVASDNMEQSAADVKLAWDNIMPTEKDLDTGFLQDITDEADKEFDKARAHLVEVFNKPMPGEAITDWLNRMRAAIDKVAKEKAEKIEQDQKPVDQGTDPRVIAGKAWLAQHNELINQELLQNNIAYEKEVKAANKHFEVMKTDKAEQAAILQQMQMEHEEKNNHIESDAARKNQAMWAASWQGKMHVVGSVLDQVAGLMNSKNRQMFEVGKAAAYASTVINTAEAAMASYKSLAGIPYVGPYLGAAAAAAAIAVGAIQLGTIASTSFGGGGSPSAGGGASIPSASGGGGGPTAQPGVTGQGGPKFDLVVNLSDDAIFSGKTVRKLMESIQGQISDGATIGSLRTT